MADRPYVVLSCAVSLDGYLDDATPRRLVLSNSADLDRVDEVRAGCDAILVGANTVRRDDPRLLIRSASRRARRVEQGRQPDPIKVTLTTGGQLPPTAQFFTAGSAAKLVYCPQARQAELAQALPGAAEIVGLPAPVAVSDVLADLAARGVRRLLVEGGGTILTSFLTTALADELQLVLAPFFVGDAAAPRFVGPGCFPFDSGRQMALADVLRMGDLVLLRYLLPAVVVGSDDR
jgi:5-amino-6-(5-phosphoribosylamino)uracil reductase